MSKFWKMILDLFWKPKPIKPTPKPPEPQPSMDDLDVSAVHFHDSESFKTARITVAITKCCTQMGSGNVDMGWTKYNWKPDSGGCDALLICMHKSGDTWYAAALEHIRPNTTGYLIPNPLAGWYHDKGSRKPHPIAGDPGAFAIMSKDGRERSNVVVREWPIDDDGIWIDVENIC
jgi:hypothetical protein